MSMLSAQLPPDSRHDLVERRGGWILSVCLHVMLFSTLIIARRAPLDFIPPHPPIRVELTASEEPAALPADAPAARRDAAPAPPPPAAPLVSAEEAPLAKPAPADATLGDPAGVKDGPLVDDPRGVVPGALKDLPGAGRVLPPVLNSVGRLTNERDKFVANPSAAPPTEGVGLAPAGRGFGDDLGRFSADELAALRREGEQVARESQAQGRAGSAAVAGRLGVAHAGVKAQSVLMGKKDLFSARGAAAGVIRNIDMSGVAQAEAQRVLARYGIRILVQQAGGAGAGITRKKADPQSGQFVHQFGKGALGIFSFGPAGIARMVQLEEAALQAQGFDPDKSRVVQVIFGIVSTGAGFDLAVKRIEVEPVRPEEK